ncbi:SMI1/KNR4 family protein [Actinoplanes sp. CA-054009]
MSERVLQHLRDTDLGDVGPQLPGAAESAPLLGELPRTYAAALRTANGFSINQGMNRIFGLRPDRHMDLRAWNEPEAWRFAWGDRPDGFLFFGETVFGDQYALRRLPDGNGFEETVYLLDANLLSAEPVAETFDEFLAKEIVRNAVMPHDPLAEAAIEKFGRVAPTHNLVLTPSLMLGGVEDVDNMMPMDSFTAMIYGGDICRAVSSIADEAVVTAVRPWTDEQGRQRLEVLLAG